MLKGILKNWLKHFLAIWVIINIYNIVKYCYRLGIGGPFTVHADGTPYTLWQRLVTHNFEKPDFLILAPFILLVECNYWCIFKKFNLLIFIAGSIVIGLLSTTVLLYLSTDGSTIQRWANFFDVALVLIGYNVGYCLLREFLYQRMVDLKNRAYRSENELLALKQQLNPHFLFNTLNYLYGTALQEKAERTADGLDMMADMMRYTVTGLQETLVPLSQEIGFIEMYLKLQQLRLPFNKDRSLSVEINFADEPLHIAPMLLIPFIENAFKYGTSADHPADIKISINIMGSNLLMQVNNTIIPGRENIKNTKTGLLLTGRRLELLYKNKHELGITTNNNVYSVILRLHLK